jgi:hypothetical protein
MNGYFRDEENDPTFILSARLRTRGRDSIKDHTTAVLELVKNSYDAGVKIVEVVIFAGSEDKAKRDD